MIFENFLLSNLDKKKRKYRRRRWRSEPGRRFHGLPKTTTDVSSTDEDSHDEDSPYESSSSEIDQKVILKTIFEGTNFTNGVSKSMY